MFSQVSSCQYLWPKILLPPIRKKRNPTRKNKVASSVIGFIRTRLLLRRIEAETCAIFYLKEDLFNAE